ncbi:MAG: precorrin-8X methylmutase [Nitrospinae bacterium]|nr:precorrin-8X methylmutase [Nitrospinota bacterium]
MNGRTTGEKALIHSIYESPVSPEQIESRSFAAIDAELPDHGFPPEHWVIVRRMIHTTANFALARDVRFSDDAVDSAVAALSDGAGIYVDSNMIRSGISVDRLKAVNPGYTREKIACHVADAGVAAEAKKAGLPRSLFAVRKAKEMTDGGIAMFGNAPVALLELNRMIIEEGVRPRLVIAMPVGFVHVVESKEELMALGVPHITLSGRFGGSPLAVSVIHSLCSIAVERKKVTA